MVIVDSQSSIKQLRCANTYFKYCMTNKIQYEAVVIHEILTGDDQAKTNTVCLHDVPNFLLGSSSHFFIFFLLKTSK